MWIVGLLIDTFILQKFLSEDMTYSSALWPDELGGVRGDLEGDESGCALQAAQLHKIKKLLKLTRVGPGDRLLEFGSGWGAMSMQVSTTTSFFERSESKLVL